MYCKPMHSSTFCSDQIRKQESVELKEIWKLHTVCVWEAPQRTLCNIFLRTLTLLISTSRGQNFYFNIVASALRTPALKSCIISFIHFFFLLNLKKKFGQNRLHSNFKMVSELRKIRRKKYLTTIRLNIKFRFRYIIIHRSSTPTMSLCCFLSLHFFAIIDSLMDLNSIQNF